MNIFGTAFCKYCHCFNEQIVLTGDREPDGGDGWNWQVAAGTRCHHCGAELRWLHEPSPEWSLVSLAAMERLTYTDYVSTEQDTA